MNIFHRFSAGDNFGQGCRKRWSPAPRAPAWARRSASSFWASCPRSTRGAPRLARDTSEGSFSSGSTPIFATKDSFCSAWFFEIYKTIWLNFQKISKFCKKWLRISISDFRKIHTFFCKIRTISILQNSRYANFQFAKFYNKTKSAR